MFATTILAVWLMVASQTAQGFQGQQGQGQQGQPGRGRGSAQNQVEITAQLVRPDGRITERAGASDTVDFQRFVWSDAMCGLTTSEKEPAKAPAIGWHVSSRVISTSFSTGVQPDNLGGRAQAFSATSSGTVVVQIDWQRLWDHGSATGHTGSQRLTMHVGDYLTLDNVDPSSTNSSCGPMGARLEVSISPATIGQAVAGLVGARSGRGTGVAGGRGATTTLLNNQPVFDAELWLVHTSPANASAGDAQASLHESLDDLRARLAAVRGAILAKSANNQHQTLRFGASGAGFVFPAILIATDKGLVGVIVTGTLSARVVNGEPTTLVVAVNRQITGSDASSAASGGGTSKDLPWPKDSDVISFELPPAAGAVKELLAGYGFALRLQVKPAVFVAGRAARGGVR